MPDADKYKPGSKPTDVTGRQGGTGTSATGSNAGPDLRPAPAKRDAEQGTTSAMPPKKSIGEGPKDQKPERGSRIVGDT